MNPLVTGGVTVSAASLAPLVSWVINGCPHPAPDSVPLLIAAGIITLGHAIYAYVTTPKLVVAAPVVQPK